MPPFSIKKISWTKNVALHDETLSELLATERPLHEEHSTLSTLCAFPPIFKP